MQVKDYNWYSSGIPQDLDLLDTEKFDEYIDIKLTRKQTNEVKNFLNKEITIVELLIINPLTIYLLRAKKSTPTVLYNLPFILHIFQISEDSYGVVVTNLDTDEFPVDSLKQLYGIR